MSPTSCTEERKRRPGKKDAEWVALMVTGSVGKLHNWSKEVGTTGGTAVMWDEKKKEFNTDPNAVLDERTHGWEDIWQCKNEEARARTNGAIKDAIKRATEERGTRSHFHIGAKDSRNGQQFQKEHLGRLGPMGHQRNRPVRHRRLGETSGAPQRVGHRNYGPGPMVCQPHGHATEEKKGTGRLQRWRAGTGSTQDSRKKRRDNGTSKTRKKTTHQSPALRV